MTAELRVKLAAASFLLSCPRYRAASSDVATHVNLTVGSVKKLGIKKKFRQLLADDSCFTVEDLHAIGACIELNIQQLLSEESCSSATSTTTSAPLHQILQQHSRQVPAPSGDAAQKQQLPKPYVAAETLYPASGNTNMQVLRLAAVQLLGSPSNTKDLASVCAAVEKKLGKQQSELVEQLLSTEEVFQLKEINGNPAVMLKVPLLRKLAAEHKADKQPASQTQVNGAATSPSVVSNDSDSSLYISSDDDDGHDDTSHLAGISGTSKSSSLVHSANGTTASSSNTVPTARQLLQYVTQHQWHSTNKQLDTVRRALAVHLVEQANATALAEGSPVDGPACSDPAEYCIFHYKAGKVAAISDVWQAQQCGM